MKWLVQHICTRLVLVLHSHFTQLVRTRSAPTHSHLMHTLPFPACLPSPPFHSCAYLHCTKNTTTQCHTAHLTLLYTHTHTLHPHPESYPAQLGLCFRVHQWPSWLLVVAPPRVRGCAQTLRSHSRSLSCTVPKQARICHGRPCLRGHLSRVLLGGAAHDHYAQRITRLLQRQRVHSEWCLARH